jgi:hypothetical protein
LDLGFVSDFDIRISDLGFSDGFQADCRAGDDPRDGPGFY